LLGSRPGERLTDEDLVTPPKQIVLIQWDSLEKAQAFFESDSYKQLTPIRDKGSNFRAFVIEGMAP
jgi:uncharacterized protein (DUF1330 family)